MESGGGGGEQDNDFSSDFLPPAATRHLYSLLGATSLQEAFVPANHKQVSRSSGKLKRHQSWTCDDPFFKKKKKRHGGMVKGNDGKNARKDSGILPSAVSYR